MEKPIHYRRKLGSGQVIACRVISSEPVEKSSADKKKVTCKACKKTVAFKV
jgi:hypothetical protein